MTLTRINKSEPTKKTFVTVRMENGAVFRMALYPDLAPSTVENFLTKARDGQYDGLNFHRWINKIGASTIILFDASRARARITVKNINPIRRSDVPYSKVMRHNPT